MNTKAEATSGALRGKYWSAAKTVCTLIHVLCWIRQTENKTTLKIDQSSAVCWLQARKRLKINDDKFGSTSGFWLVVILDCNLYKDAFTPQEVVPDWPVLYKEENCCGMTASAWNYPDLSWILVSGRLAKSESTWETTGVENSIKFLP